MTTPPNTYRVASITVHEGAFSSTTPRSFRNEYVFGLIHQALTSHPDLIVLPELCWLYGIQPGDWKSEAETRHSPRIRAVAALARKHHCYILVPLLEKRGEHLYNTVLLIGRDGKTKWHYDKIFPTGGELEHNIQPGKQIKPYKTDFGRIGAAICFDLNFMELAQAWGKQKVRLILFSSMFVGGAKLASWALSTKAYLATAIADNGSQIVNPLGQALGRTSRHNPVLIRDLPRDFEVFHIDYNNQKWAALRQEYGDRIHMEIESELAHFILESRDPKLRVSDIIKKHRLLPLHQALPLWRKWNQASCSLLGKLGSGK